jgi:hypothetical protein
MADGLCVRKEASIAISVLLEPLALIIMWLMRVEVYRSLICSRLRRGHVPCVCDRPWFPLLILKNYKLLFELNFFERVLRISLAPLIIYFSRLYKLRAPRFSLFEQGYTLFIGLIDGWLLGSQLSPNEVVSCFI